MCFRLEDTTCQSLFQAVNMLPVYIQGYYRQRPNVRGMVSYVINARLSSFIRSRQSRKHESRVETSACIQ